MLLVTVGSSGIAFADDPPIAFEDGQLLERNRPSVVWEAPGAGVTASLESEIVFESSITPDVTVAECSEAIECEDESERRIDFDDWVGYNSASSNTSWLAGDEFGMFSMESYPNLDLGEGSGLETAFSVHFLDGPTTTPNSPADLPARLFDFQLAHQSRLPLGEHWMLDVRLGVGAFSDFEGSARKGVRFPGHAVSYWQHHDRLVSVLGVEMLDRDDISLLPVAGWLFQPTEDLIVEAIFPRPRLQLRLPDDQALTISGELGGGTWAIERLGNRQDNFTYRDLRLLIGVVDFDDTDSTLELGWAFDRSLEYRSGRGDRNFAGAFLLRFHKHY